MSLDASDGGLEGWAVKESPLQEPRATAGLSSASQLGPGLLGD